MFSKTVGYAVRAIIYIALKRGTISNTTPTEIAENLNVSESYIKKILQSLVKHEILQSHKGPKGGFTLTEITLDTTVLEIIDIIDDGATFSKCSLGLQECNPKHPCPIHFDVVGQRDSIKSKLSKRTVLQMATAYENSNNISLA
ncbi:MAG: Rrf2 family transcriptional regulator [Bacteroidia bacterium]